MKNPAEPNSPTADLPSFLDTGTDMATRADDGSLATDAMDTNVDETFAEDEGDAADASVPAHEFDDDEPVDADAPGRASLLRRRAAATEPVRGADGGAGIGSLVVGGVAVVCAALLATVLEASNAATALERFGITPATLVVLAGVAFTASTLRRHLATLQARVADTGSGDSEFTRTAQESLEFLVAAQHASNERPPAAGEELQHVLMAMQRQDEKINNLTKAIKMYGKPLMEISGQTTDLAGAVAQTKTSIEAAAEAARQAFSRLEGHLRDDAAPKKERAEMLDALHVIAADVDKLTKKQVAVSLEPVQQHLGKLEVAIAALSQRLESSEVQKSLLRLEDATQKTRDEVHQLRGDGLGKATTQLQDRLEKATKGLADGLQQMRDGNLGGLENGVREIQRELSGVATTVAQIQAIVRSGKGSVAAAAVASAPAPAPAATPAPAAPAPAATNKTDDAGTGYQTGTRSTSSKNVLGAIAKLKQMKN
ncbi:MAG: hypothetical protein JNM25_16385 [Planctomycetes bacterium]|nr:hypothetical protein [Planctomycetota bacterium]